MSHHDRPRARRNPSSRQETTRTETVSQPDAWTFFRQWLRNPRAMAALSPSSRQLARLMIEQLPRGAQPHHRARRRHRRLHAGAARARHRSGSPARRRVERRAAPAPASALSGCARRLRRCAGAEDDRPRQRVRRRRRRRRGRQWSWHAVDVANDAARDPVRRVRGAARRRAVHPVHVRTGEPVVARALERARAARAPRGRCVAQRAAGDRVRLLAPSTESDAVARASRVYANRPSRDGCGAITGSHSPPA